MVTRLRTCGNCRRENAEFEGVVLATDEEMQEEQEETNPFDMSPGTISISNAVVVRELREYRNDTRHFHTHYHYFHTHYHYFGLIYPSILILIRGTITIECWSNLQICFRTRSCTCTVV